MEPPVPFTKREMQVIELLLLGKSNKQIALALGVSVRAVEFHLSHIYSKLEVSSRTEAAIKLSELRLREPTGIGLRESTVVEPEDRKHNGSIPGSTWRLPVNKSSVIGLAILIATSIFFVGSLYSMAKERAEAHEGEYQVPGPSFDPIMVPSEPATPSLSPKEQVIEGRRMTPIIANVKHAADIELIREVVGDPDLQLTFQSITELANAPWRTAALYTGETGTRYYVDKKNFRLAVIEPNVHSQISISAAEKKSMDTLRDVAREFAFTNSPRLGELESVLLYEESCKEDICFFRWDHRNRDWIGTDWLIMPPFLQVGVLENGQIISYINTLDLFE